MDSIAPIEQSGDEAQAGEEVAGEFVIAGGDGTEVLEPAVGPLDDVQDLVVVLLDLRRRLIDEYGDTPGSMMLIDRTVAAYQDFIRISGWTGNAALMVEHEFFGHDRPCFEFRDGRGREGPKVHGLTVEQHIAQLRDNLIPLAERSSRVMREALAALEMLRAAPSQAVERSRPTRISVVFEQHSPG